MHPEPNPPEKDEQSFPGEGPDEMFRFEKIMEWNAQIAPHLIQKVRNCGFDTAKTHPNKGFPLFPLRFP